MIEFDHIASNRQAVWKALCECGKYTKVRATKAKSGHTTSCGCRAVNKPLKLEGQKFGKLTVLRKFDGPKTSSRHQLWVCKCDCGNIVNVGGSKLKIGHSTSCGCKALEHIAELNKTHGLSKTSTYSAWLAMKSRCNNPNNINYKNYGGRSISVCDRWENSFENFLEDMGPRPKDLTLERIDNNGDYTPENCKWATKAEQGRNKRSNRRLTYQGRDLILTDFARELGAPIRGVSKLLSKGMTPEQIAQRMQ